MDDIYKMEYFFKLSQSESYSYQKVTIPIKKCVLVDMKIIRKIISTESRATL